VPPSLVCWDMEVSCVGVGGPSFWQLIMVSVPFYPIRRPSFSHVCFDVAEFISSADVMFSLEPGGAISMKTRNEICLGMGGKVEMPSQPKDPEINEQDVGDASTTDHTPDAITQSPDEKVDLQRQGGDFTLYQFYFQSVSKVTIAAWFILAFLYVVTYQMPSMTLPYLIPRLGLVARAANRDYSDLGANMARKGSEQQSVFHRLCCLGGSRASIRTCGSGVCGPVDLVQRLCRPAKVLCRFFMLKFLPESAGNLHQTLLDVVMRLVRTGQSLLAITYSWLRHPLWYFTEVDTGNILNR
jgi:hypothetical protein